MVLVHAVIKEKDIKDIIITKGAKSTIKESTNKDNLARLLKKRSLYKNQQGLYML